MFPDSSQNLTMHYNEKPVLILQWCSALDPFVFQSFLPNVHFEVGMGPWVIVEEEEGIDTEGDDFYPGRGDGSPGNNSMG